MSGLVESITSAPHILALVYVSVLAFGVAGVGLALGFGLQFAVRRMRRQEASVRAKAEAWDAAHWQAPAPLDLEHHDVR